VYERDSPREEVDEYSSSDCGFEIEAALNAEFGSFQGQLACLSMFAHCIHIFPRLSATLQHLGD
jgi:hypothetical protein